VGDDGHANLLVDHFRKGKYDRVTDSLDATPGNQEDGLTIAEQLEDGGASPEAAMRSRRPGSWFTRR